MTRHTFTLVGAITLLLVGTGNALAQEADTFEVEFFGGNTMKLQGSRAFVTTFDGRATRTADSGAHAVLPSIGLAVSRWHRVFGVYSDFSYVHGGTALASIGSNSSEVTSRVFDFHGGVQAQYPGERVRPYLLFGAGFAHGSARTALTLAGYTNSANHSLWLTSFIVGGGVRLAFNDASGVRIALEGVEVSPIRTNSTTERTSYGRFLVGVFLSSKPRQAPPALPPGRLSIPTAAIPREPDVARQTIDDIRAGAHGTLPPAERTGRNAGGATTVSYENQTDQMMRVYLAGPQNLTLTLAPRTTQDVRLEPGQYEVGVRVANEAVRPFYGTHQYARGMSHDFAFYIETSVIRVPN